VHAGSLNKVIAAEESALQVTHAHGTQPHEELPLSGHGSTTKGDVIIDQKQPAKHH
jgi:hypothetical protein